MPRTSTATLSGLVLCVAAGIVACRRQPPAAGARATVFEGARLITGDEAPPSKTRRSWCRTAGSWPWANAVTCRLRKAPFAFI